jgi:ATP-dependent Lon protease
MNLVKVVGCAACFLYSFSAFSQDAAATVSDEELKKYAVAMDSIEDMKNELLTSMSEFVKNNEKITGERYNELSKLIDDEAKLTAANATADEISAIREVIKMKEEGTAKIQQTFQALAKEFVGASVYNKVKKALADPEVKTRYEAILAEHNKTDT